MPTAEILSQGDEVVTGQIADTNAAWLADQLTGLGFEVVRHSTVGDRQPDITALFVEAAARADLLVCTGGLGPTDDDLTADAAASAFARPLRFDDEAWQQIQALFQRYRREIPAVNRKQAWLPQGSLRLDNPNGTAPGFALPTAPHGQGWLACMPGVPHEMKAMFTERVLPQLHQRWALHPGRLVTLHTTGVGESTLQERIGTFDHPHIVLSYRTTPGANLIKLRARPEIAEADLHDVVSDLCARIGSPVFSIDGLTGYEGGDLVEVIARALLAAGHTLALAESCTGGQVASMCTALPGSSAWFIEGLVTYANASKTRHLGVPAALIAEHGAVSEPVARAMAEGIRQVSGATIGIGITGIAGPTGGSTEKPVGTVHLALSAADSTTHRLLRLGGTRARIQTFAAFAALDLLRRHLTDSPS